MGFSRRDFAKFAPTLLALGFMPRVLLAAETRATTPGHSGFNFRYIYGNKDLRERFHMFLQNVFSLYRDPQAHNLILELTSAQQSDENVYRELQRRFPEAKPWLSLFTASLPALRNQKREMRQQTSALIGNMKTASGYVEIGTTGRYFEGIQESVKLEGNIYILNTNGPTSSPGDIVERGQLSRVGKFIKMGDYDPVSATQIRPASIDLISNYIGFHHAPPEKRNMFIESVVATLRPGGRLVLRDHDASSQDMKFMAALAHDVFNAGLDLSWERNLAEIRNFTSIAEIADRVSRYGVAPQSSRLLQEGDPTRNTLMVFVKT